MIFFSVAAVLLIGSFFLYRNLNKILGSALQKAFDSTLVADVYELRFENLRVNPFDGDISVLNVSIKPREKPRKHYPYINSTLQLQTGKLILQYVDILLLLRSNRLSLEKVSIISPDLELDVNGYNPIFVPFNEVMSEDESGETNLPDSYFLAEFQLQDARVRLINSAKEREFQVERFSMSFMDLSLVKSAGEDLFFLREMEISLEKFSGSTTSEPLQHLGFSAFKIKFDSVDATKNLDTLMFEFRHFTSQLKDLDIHTQDSLYHISLGAFDLSYQDQLIQLEDLSFKPNVSNAVIQKNYKFQHTQFSGTIGEVELRQVDFDSMIYANKFFVEEIYLDSISALIYKDNTKAKDLNHFPEYPGQAMLNVPYPVRINQLKADHVDLRNEERKPDGHIARVSVNSGIVEARNITNLAPTEEMTLEATAYLANNVKINLDLMFSYSIPQFTFDGVVDKFELTQINQILEAYTPAKFTNGTADQITFSGLANRTSATGSLTFLYHDLKVDLTLENKAKWKSDLLTFGANTALHSNNPASDKIPARSVKSNAERDMNRGFVNLVIKSILDGMRETMLLSKENRKEFNRAKREARKDDKRKD